ncbi:DUF5675 family protein [Aequorivita sp. SDUM287046]|uniref:DUF5675 family protein n=1 Tax=Aequorivita aurantiaca TaxID=3053356 RepID=A0ABT8DIA2_9FLAO|nr:DUF5675 family protein [Aequorivita aurantiaca]MDN3725130.1 DUF5675 family protein [Aequorivita aurantiaca]
MELFLFRSHFRAGTNGMLFHKQHFICFSIELPLRCNQENDTCIPDGVYELERCYSLEFGHHLRVLKVPERCGILFRAGTNQLEDLKGAIIPVMQLAGIGKGYGSTEALHKLLLRMEAASTVGQSFFLTVSSVLGGR